MMVIKSIKTQVLWTYTGSNYPPNCPFNDENACKHPHYKCGREGGNNPENFRTLLFFFMVLFFIKK